MEVNGYYQPESCQKGRVYFVREENSSTVNKYIKKLNFWIIDHIRENC